MKKTNQWIDNVVLKEQQDANSTKPAQEYVADELNAELNQLLASARKVSNSDLSQQLHYLETLKFAHNKQQLCCTYAKAILAMRTKQFKLALHLLEALFREHVKVYLYWWEPKFSKKIIQDLLTCITALYKKNSDINLQMLTKLKYEAEAMLAQITAHALL